MDASEPRSQSLGPDGTDHRSEPILLVVHKARAAFCAAWASSGERIVAQTRPRPF
jgi:hypothetical protein